MFLHYLLVFNAALLMSIIFGLLFGVINYFLSFAAYSFMTENLRTLMYWRKQSFPEQYEVEQEMFNRHYFWYYVGRTHSAISLVLGVSVFIQTMITSSAVIVFTGLVPHIFSKG